MAKKYIAPKIIEIDIHQHDMANFLMCPVKFQVNNVLNYHPRGISKALNIGDLFAKCVYWLHKGTPIAECMAYVDKKQEDLILLATGQEAVDELETSVVTVQAMLNGYKETFLEKKTINITKFNNAGGIEGFEEITIKEIFPEYHITVPIKIGNYVFNYVNRLDAKIITIDNRVFILELKTTSQFDSDLVKKLNTNFQINSYWFALNEKEKVKVDGILYRYIKKPSIKQKQNETLDNYRKRIMLDYLDRPDNYFKEECLFFNQEMTAKFKKNMNYWFTELLRCYLMNEWVPRGVACDAHFGLCEYIKYCNEPTKDTLMSFYKKGE